MSDEILSLIYTFSKKFNDPETNLSFDPKNQNISKKRIGMKKKLTIKKK